LTQLFPEVVAPGGGLVHEFCDDPACRRCADASLQIERVARKTDHTRDQAKVDVFEISNTSTISCAGTRRSGT
jgi:hypothetical protein